MNILNRKNMYRYIDTDEAKGEIEEEAQQQEHPITTTKAN